MSLVQKDLTFSVRLDRICFYLQLSTLFFSALFKSVDIIP